MLAEDGAKFAEDRWERDSSNPHAGYGITSVLEGNSLLEKVCYSCNRYLLMHVWLGRDIDHEYLCSIT